MQYQRKRFRFEYSSGGNNDVYRDNWERIFGKKEPEKRPTCIGCGNEIDPDVCWCGDDTKGHGYGAGHGAVPMGCTCLRTAG